MHRLSLVFMPMWALVLSLAPACGVGMLQTARTTPRGQLNTTLGLGYIHNWQVGKRGVTPYNFPPQVSLRYGLSDRLDIGASLLFLSGLSLDAKYNFMPPDHPLALSLRGGLGGAFDFLSGEEARLAINLPLSALASYRVLHWLEPYCGVGYSVFWIWVPPMSRPDVLLDENQSLVGRGYYGDGIVTATLGVALHASDTTSFLLEYNFWWAVVDDPGDFYAFSNSHILMAGIAF